MLRLSVVVPAYREADRIGATVRRLRDELAEVAGDGGLEIVVVDDGSDDATADAALAAGADQVVVQPRNRGKGAAVRAGVLAARGRTVAFTDADLAYAPDQVLRVLAAVEDGLGRRRRRPAPPRHADARARRRGCGRWGSRAINWLGYAVLLGSYRDTQCGLKAFRSDVARFVFARTRVDGFAFDVEVLHLVERYQLSLVEVPGRGGQLVALDRARRPRRRPPGRRPVPHPPLVGRRRLRGRRRRPPCTRGVAS